MLTTTSHLPFLAWFVIHVYQITNISGINDFFGKTYKLSRLSRTNPISLVITRWDRRAWRTFTFFLWTVLPGNEGLRFEMHLVPFFLSGHKSSMKKISFLNQGGF